MNRYGGPNGPMGYNSPGMFQSVMEGGYNRMRDFGNVVEGVSRFSRLLDANFDAMHGSVGSVLRMIDVAGTVPSRLMPPVNTSYRRIPIYH